MSYHSGRIAAFFLFAGAMLVSSKASATVVVDSDFSDGYNPGQSLIGQAGKKDVGLDGVFQAYPDAASADAHIAPSITVVPAESASSLTYQVTGGGTIKSGPNIIELQVPEGSVHNLFCRPLKTMVTGVTLYARIVIVPATAISCTETDLLFALTNMDGRRLLDSPSLSLGLFHQKTGASINGINKPIAYSKVLNPGVANLLVARYDWDGSRYSKISFWLNPAVSAKDQPDASIDDPQGAQTMSYLAVGCANMVTNSTIYFGSWTIATKWNEVVPEALN